MKVKLVIVESPAKAKTIGKFLGRGYRVQASNGHVRDLPKSQIGVDIENDFEPKYITIRGRGEVLEKIRKEAKNASTVYLATDPDREGEAIAWHLTHILHLDANQPCRIQFNEITSKAVKDSIKHARPIDKDLVDAQQARRVLDRLVGYQISPLLWRKVRKGLSAGRVQSVAMRLICEREEDVAAFVPREYWQIHAKLTDTKGKHRFAAYLCNADGAKAELEPNEVQPLMDFLGDAAFAVTNIRSGERRKSPPAPFTTSNLQQEAARKLSFTTKKTMMVAQQLYEGIDIASEGTVGLVTYIRTDSNRVATEAQTAALDYIKGRFGDAYVPATPNQYKGRKGMQDAHEAIRPTSILRTPEAVKASLSRDQFRLYKLIYDRFMASQMTPAVYETMAVTIEAKQKQETLTFKANSSRLSFPGFTAAYVEGTDEEETDRETKLPALKEGQALCCEEPLADQHFTQPPARYTEASLVRTLEELGIGRPSTYAPTISTIFDRGYLEREGKSLVPTELGNIVDDIIKQHFTDIVNVSFTADMEDQLDKVEEGKLPWKKVVEDFYASFEPVLQRADAAIEKVELKPEVTDIPCDQCGAMMVIKMGRYGKFLACPNFPACHNTRPLLTPVEAPCPKCGAQVFQRRSRKGRIFYGCERYPECDYTSWDMPVREQCPQCGGPMVQKKNRNGTFVVCADKSCGYRRQLEENDG